MGGGGVVVAGGIVGEALCQNGALLLLLWCIKLKNIGVFLSPCIANNRKQTITANYMYLLLIDVTFDYISLAFLCTAHLFC